MCIRDRLITILGVCAAVIMVSFALGDMTFFEMCIRDRSGIDQPIYPIAYIKNKIPMAKKAAVCSYTCLLYTSRCV